MNPPAPPSPELAARIDQTVAAYNAQAPRELNSSLTQVGASRVANSLNLEMVVSRELAELTRDAPRGALADVVERSWRPDMCADPVLRSIVDMGGLVDTQFVDNIGRRLFKISVDRC